MNYNEKMEEKATIITLFDVHITNIIKENYPCNPHHHRLYEAISTVSKNNNNVFVFFIISYMDSTNIRNVTFKLILHIINSVSLKHGAVLGEEIVQELYLKL